MYHRIHMDQIWLCHFCFQKKKKLPAKEEAAAPDDNASIMQIEKWV